MKAKDLYMVFISVLTDDTGFYEDYDPPINVIAEIEEIVTVMQIAADEAVGYFYPDEDDPEEAREDFIQALKNMYYIRDALQVLETLNVLDKGEGEWLYIYLLQEIPEGHSFALEKFCSELGNKSLKTV